jgi:hypothetical protein
LLARLTGASGTLRIIAPFPEGDTGELPLMLVAITCAEILDPQAKPKGVPVKVILGTEQLRAETIAA